MRRFVLSMVFACALVAPAAGAENAKAARPNILFIYADDQSYKTISCYGSSPEWVETPNIDKLAARGVLFENMFVTTSICWSSRATMFTGQWMRRQCRWWW